MKLTEISNAPVLCRFIAPGLILAAGCGHPTAASPAHGTANAMKAAEIPTDGPTAATAPKMASPEDQPPLADHGNQNSPLATAKEPAPPGDQTAATVPGEPLQPSTAEKAPPKPPPADRGPVRPGDAEKITFDDLNLGMQADIVFRPIMLSFSDRVSELTGKRVSIVGYMHGGQAAQRGIKEFILLKNTQCKFGPGGQADHLANVVLREGVTTGLTTKPVKVEGTLRIDPFEGPDGNTWSIYRLDDSQIR